MNQMELLTNAAQRWSHAVNIANVFYVLGTAFALLASGAIWATGIKSAAVNAQLQALKDEDTHKRQLAADTQIASLNADAQKAKERMTGAEERIAEAKRQAAEANSKAAANSVAEEARVKQEELANENVKLRLRLEASIAETHTKQAELERTQTKSSRVIEGVKQNQSPRMLSPSQMATLKGKLEVFPSHKVQIESLSGDAEAQDLANQFGDVFRSAGWKVENHQYTYDQAPFGVMVFVREGNDPPQWKDVFGSTLFSFGFDVQGLKITDLPDDVLRIIVGAKRNRKAD